MMSAVGDAVQVLPVVNALKRHFPETRISWLIQPGPHSLVRDHPSVDEFLLFPRRRGGKRPQALASGAHALRYTARALHELASRQPGGRFDLLLNLQVYFKAGVLTALTPAQVKLGFDWKRTRDLNWLFTTNRIPPHPRSFAHTQDQYFEFLRYLGVEPEPVEYGLDLTQKEGESQQDFFRSLGRPACSLVVASSNPEKDWFPTGYARVAESLYHDFGLQPILVGGDSLREVEIARKIMALARVPIHNALGDGLRRLLWILGGSALVISPDTGPLHMARAMEVPVVGLYGYTNPKRSGPFRMFQDLVVDGYAMYAGEAYPLSPKRRRGGMGRITTEMVLEKVSRALALPPAGPGPESLPEEPPGTSPPRR